MFLRKIEHRCSVCGATEGRFTSSPFGVLCARHYQQYYRHGKISNSSSENYRFNKNDVLDLGNGVSEIILLDYLGHYKGSTIVDTEDIKMLSAYKWHINDQGYALGSRRSNGSKEHIRMHRFLMNASEDLVVDHINGNRLDNRKSNLRICTKHQNSISHHRIAKNDSGCLGVYLDKNTNKWTSAITVNCKTVHLGSFHSKEEAIQARLAAEDKYYGEFAPQYNSQFR